MNETKSNKKALFYLILCYAAYTSIYVARLNLSMASPSFLEGNILTEAQIGLLGSVFSVVYAIGRLLNGTLSDKRPPWVMISGGLVLCAVANIGVGFLPPFAGFLLLWGANAFAQSMLWSSILCIIAAAYPPVIAKRKTSIMVTAVATGNILGILINMVLIDQFGVRWAFIIPGAVTLLLGGAVILTMRGVKGVEAAKSEKHESIFALFRHQEIRLTVLPAVLHGVIKDNISLWMAAFFVSTYSIDLKQSSYFILLIPTVGFVGRLIYSPLYRLCKEREHKLSLFGFIVCVACCVPLLIPGNPPFSAMICLSLLYAAISVINTSFLSIYPVRFVVSGNVASVSGIMDFATYLGAGIGSLIFGVLVENYGYAAMFAVWLGVSVLSVILTAILYIKYPGKKN